MKICSIRLAAILFTASPLFPFPARAATEVVDGIEWTYFISWGRAYLGNLYSNTVSTSTSGAIRVPDMLGGYPVTEIQPQAFRGCNKITSISIPDSVKVIYASAFEGCSSNLFDRTTMPGALLVDGWLVGFAEVPPPHGTVLLDMNDQCFRGIGVGWGDDSSTWPVSVIVKDGTENLNGTFREWGTLVSVTLPDSVRNIGFATFEGCTSLVSVAMSQCVTNIADSAFRGCTALESLDLPDTVVSLGWDAFGECESLRELSILNVRSIPQGAFMMCRSLERIDFSPAITNIGWAAFAECEALRTMPDLGGLTMIPPYAFHRCASLTDAIIPNNVTNIGERAFSCCSNLVTVVLPQGLGRNDIETGYDGDWPSFGECLAIRHVTLQGTWEGEEDEFQRFVPLREVFPAAYADLESVVFLEGTTAIGHWTLEGCDALRSMKIPDSVECLEFDQWWARDECPDLVDWETAPGFGLIDGWIVASDFGISGDLDLSGFRGISCMAFSNTTNAFSISALPSAMTSIARGMFGNGCSITSIVIHAGVTNIGDTAFSYCGKLESVTLPDGLLRIGQQAFEGCAISSVAIPESVTEIGDYAFGGCISLSSLTIPASVTRIGSRTFSGCSDELFDTTLIPGVMLVNGWSVGYTSGLPGELDLTGVRGIAGNAFYGCTWLTSVAIPDNVLSIGDDAFAGCTGLVSFTIGAGISSSDNIPHDVEEYHVNEDSTSFSALDGVLFDKAGTTLLYFPQKRGSSYSIPGGVTCIGDYAFSGCSRLSSISFPGGVASIGNYAFYKCTGLTSITIPNNVTHIAESAFYWCTRLSSEFVPSHLEKTFLPKGNVKTTIWFYDSPVDWGRFDGMNGWDFTVDATRADGFCLKSASVSAGETATMEATLDAASAGTLSFDWRISSGRGDYAKLYVDGVVRAGISRSTDWATLRIPLEKGSHTLRWTYEKGYGATGGEDAAFLDAVAWTPLTLAEALDATNLVWTTEGESTWEPQFAVASDATGAVRSGTVSQTGTSRLSTTVVGAGTLSWSWRADVEGIAGVDVWLDGTNLYDEGIVLEGASDWTTASLAIDGAGTHAVSFEFWNAGSSATSNDCAYLDAVAWTPELPETVTAGGVTLPGSWLDENAADILLANGRNYAAAANATAANGVNKVWECYVAGISPTNAAERFEATIEIGADGNPRIAWNPDLNENGTKTERVYTVEGKANLTDSWGPTNAASRFFHVKVGMPE